MRDADFGPNLSNIAAKFASREQGYQVARQLDQGPRGVPSQEPDAQPATLRSRTPPTSPRGSSRSQPSGRSRSKSPKLESPEVKQGLDDLVRLYLGKGAINLGGKPVVVSLTELDDFVAKKLTQEEKLMYLGERTISRLGCFGCHSIPGFENAKPIGTPLNGWGIKSPAKLDYAPHHRVSSRTSRPDSHEARDGTPLYYQEKLDEHTRSGFLFQKLHRPRSYDFRKTSEDLKAWDDRLRMPQFAWADDPAGDRGGDDVRARPDGREDRQQYLPRSKTTAAQDGVAQGSKLLHRYNCTGCHVVEMPRYTIPAGTKLEDGPDRFRHERAGGI